VTALASARVAKWKRWLKVLDDEVTALYHHRAVWQEIAKTIDGNQAIPRTAALNMLHTMYAAAQAVAVRRIAEPGTRDISFGSLLVEIRDHASDVTEQWWLSHYDDAWSRALGGRRDWKNNFAGTIGTHLDAALVRADLIDMERRVEPISRYVDKWLAHRDRRPPRNMPTFADLNRAIDCLGQLLTRYTLLLEVADRQIIAPVVVGDVMAPFRMAWLPRLARPRSRHPA
jgi:hypothetical protein